MSLNDQEFEAKETIAPSEKKACKCEMFQYVACDPFICCEKTGKRVTERCQSCSSQDSEAQE
jgi:hypothetical protein